MTDLTIQQAFVDGINEVFSIMFTNNLMFKFLDIDNTQFNVYNETVEKVYKEPIQIVGKVILSVTKGEDPVESVEFDATIDIPVKQFILNEIPYELPQDLENMRKALISYQSVDYLIEEVQPKTLVADKWQVYTLKCRVDKNTSLER